MKKILSLMLAVSLSLALCACASTVEDNGDDIVDEPAVEYEYEDETYYVEEETQPTASVQSSSTATNNNYSENTSNNNQNTNDNYNYSSSQPSYTAPASTTTTTSSETHTHTWKEAICEERKTCTTCGETTGSRLDHNYTPETCTTPKTCTMCGKTRGSADGHEYFNDSCSKCGNKITIPFTVEYDTNMSYTLYGETCYFSVEQYNIIDVDKYSEGYAEICVTVRNDTGGRAYYSINYYDANGRILDTNTCHVVESAGASATTDRYIPINTARIVITAYVK